MHDKSLETLWLDGIDCALQSVESSLVKLLYYADAAGKEDTWRATWMTSQHESQVLTNALSEDAQEEQTLELTIGLKRKDLGKQSRRGRKHRSNPQDVVLSTTLAAKVVARSVIPCRHKLCIAIIFCRQSS